MYEMGRREQGYVYIRSPFFLSLPVLAFVLATTVTIISAAISCICSVLEFPEPAIDERLSGPSLQL